MDGYLFVLWECVYVLTEQSFSLIEHLPWKIPHLLSIALAFVLHMVYSPSNISLEKKTAPFHSTSFLCSFEEKQ